MADPAAYTRHTRIPIYYESTPDSYGTYWNDNQPSFLQSHLPQLASILGANKPARFIQLDPNKPGKTNTIAHEGIHSLLEPMGLRQLHQLADSNPFFQKIADNILSQNRGDPVSEAPAYVRTPNDITSAYGSTVDNDFFTQYRNKLVGQLMKIDPNIAKKYQTITGAHPIE